MNGIATFFRETGLARFLIPLGIILIVFSIFLFSAVEHNKNYIKTKSVVYKTELVEDAHTDENGNMVDATYNVYVKYTVNDKEYIEQLGEMSGYKEGDEITIAYNPNNPKEISQPTTIIFPIVLLSTGVAVLIGGIISLIKSIKKYKMMKDQERRWADSE